MIGKIILWIKEYIEISLYIKKHSGCGNCSCKKYYTYEEKVYPYETIYICKRCGSHFDTWLNR